LGEQAQLVFLFGSTGLIRERRCFDSIRTAYPRAVLFGCSTAGEIHGDTVSDDSLSVTAVAFEYTRTEIAHLHPASGAQGIDVGRRLARQFDPAGLTHVLMLSAGLRRNGSDLVRGVVGALPPGVTVSGGLAGDAVRFEETYVLCSNEPTSGAVAALGFYGGRIHVGCAAATGWDPFGPDRVITRSRGNVLYELDGCSALALYRRYLGEHADGLPATALQFPMNVVLPGGRGQVIRSVQAVNEAEQSLLFAGDIPQGCRARLMRANLDRVVDGAMTAAQTSLEGLCGLTPALAVVISCVGRRLVMKQRIEEEIEVVREVVGESAALTGFYSYAEIAPCAAGGPSMVHNQTMAVTTFLES
jgi:hypothetical protein